jgi:3-methyladenine DNA glycosylase AlkC
VFLLSEGEKIQNIYNSSSKKHPDFAQMVCQVWLAHLNITHWIHMDDIRGLNTLYKGVVTANDV